MYPNPASDVVVFELENYSADDYLIAIHDATGKLVHTTTFNNSSYEFRKGQLSFGLYLYRLIGKGNFKESRTFIIL